MSPMRIAAWCLLSALMLVPHTRSLAQVPYAPAVPSDALAQNPVKPAGPLQQAYDLMQKGDFAEATKRVDAYLAEHPKDARGRFLKGLILSGQQKTDEAIKAFTDLTYDFPELPEPYNNLGVLLAARGEYEKARDALMRAIQARPNFAVAHENLGDIYAQLAAQSYAQALKLESNNTTAQKKLALVKQLVSSAPPPAPAPSGAAGSTGTPSASR